ncbi:MAG: NAD-dependent epimerase/dehydratase family protein [Thermodesulfobacteriota bacterium]|jgi:nucleoside-diphosphate-sugar epimerase
MKEREEFSDQRILVVGGAGFVGGNLIRRLLQSSPREILIVDNLLSAEGANIPVSPEITFVEGSITDDKILEDLRDDLDFVFHLATYHGNQNSICNPLLDHDNNTLTTLKLFERIKGFTKIKKVVYASAGCTVAEKTFDEANATKENAPVSLYLDSPYQISKIVGEFYSNYYFKQYRLPVVKARFQNVYGPGEILGAGEWRGTPATIWRNVIPTFVFRAIKKMPLMVENEGKATRDFIYVDDIVRGLILCATRGVPGEVYNLASGLETSIFDLAKLVNRLTNNNTPIEFAPKRDWDNSGRRFGSTLKAKEKIGFEAQVGVKDGLRRTIKWTEENFSLIETCIRKHKAYIA